MLLRRIFVLLAAASITSACAAGDTAGPAAPRILLSAAGDSVVFAAIGSVAPLQVLARNVETNALENGVTVNWRALDGGTLQNASTTSGYGTADNVLRGAPAGIHRVTASTADQSGPAPTLRVHIVAPPVLTAVAPAAIQAGAEAVLTGSGFSTTAAHNVVTFDGVRATVTSATPTELRVTVPRCLPTRTVRVAVALGAVAGGQRDVPNTGVSGAALDLAAGQAVTLADAASLACMRLPAIDGSMYLVTVHNVATTHAPPVRTVLRALGPASSTAVSATARTAPAMSTSDAARAPAAQPAQPFGESWESALRMRERAQFSGTNVLAASHAAAASTVPVVGERRSFDVLNSQNRFEKVNAVARVVTQNAVFYVDETAAASLSDADVARFGELFEDPIFPTSVEVFGQPSDIDGNGRVTVLLTPAVNRLTPRSSSSFVAGFFYGCDLVSTSRCAGSNRGELFYSMVPDPDGQWGDARPLAVVLAAVPPVLAHEMQHMINFAQRGFSNDALWLSEALAHSAEEVIADVLQQRGELQLATAFRSGNHSRAQRYLARTSDVNLLSEETPGTIEMRGAGWLLLKYLRGHHGDLQLLRRLTASSASGTANVEAQTGRPWAATWADFGVAVWADGAPELRAAPQPRHLFTNFEPRAVLGSFGYPLRPLNGGWSDLAAPLDVSAAGHAHVLLTAPAAAPLTFLLADTRGGDPGRSVSLTILRVR